MDESEDQAQNPLSEENWMKQNNFKFIKYCYSSQTSYDS